MMDSNKDKQHFPEQHESEKIHGIDNGESLAQDATDLGTNTASMDSPGSRHENNNSDFRSNSEGKEKYISEVANIEDVPSDMDREPVDENSSELNERKGN